MSEHYLTVRYSNPPLWHIRCKCGWFKGQVTWKYTWQDVDRHLRRINDLNATREAFLAGWQLSGEHWNGDDPGIDADLDEMHSHHTVREALETGFQEWAESKGIVVRKPYPYP